ncbi:PREDICTED: uncharacterized protein LOC109480341 [Branchiostoma belcheri]|uniref:Uncharacterized protein LOC109480341 n=1 Tax=Branchiostoma belcheri TaxID=7741 RepID=A0A6P4ZMT2_BRABE|nr:PREDICTED: uncharacterized protein LOC109480341 [Branchiostoma belcheri]
MLAKFCLVCCVLCLVESRNVPEKVKAGPDVSLAPQHRSVRSTDRRCPSLRARLVAYDRVTRNLRAEAKAEKEYLQILEKERGILNKQFKDCARYFDYIVPDYSCGSLMQLILKYDTRIGFSEHRLFQHHQDLDWLDVQRDMTREQYEACTYRRWADSRARRG